MVANIYANAETHTEKEGKREREARGKERTESTSLTIQRQHIFVTPAIGKTGMVL